MFKYPITKKVDQVDDYFGTAVGDPYRWLEDDQSQETKKWVEAQNNIMQDFLSQSQDREKIKKRLEELYNFERYSAPFKRGDNVFFFKNNGLQNQSILYIQRPGKEEEVFIDPNTLSEEGSSILSNIVFSKEGKYCAYALSPGGGDWDEYSIKNVETGEEYPETIKWIKESKIAFKGEGFYYAKLQPPKKGEELTITHQGGKLFYHKLGTDQSEDEVVFEEKDNHTLLFPATLDKERYLVLKKSKEEQTNAFSIKDLESHSDFVSIVDNFNYEHEVIGVVEGVFYAITNKHADKRKIVSFTLDNPVFKQVVKEQDYVIEEAHLVGGNLIVEYLRNASSYVCVYSLSGKFVKSLTLPEVGLVAGFDGSHESKETYFLFGSVTRPYSIYKLDLQTLDYECYREPQLTFNPQEYETTQVRYKSKDGTSIPMFITHRKDLKLNGHNPCLLYGYGGFHVSLPPYFSPSVLFFLEQGGVYAQPSLRGGGEFGEQWHRAGMKLNKQTVFDDFQYAAEFLIKEKYTSSQKLAIKGGSNGGLLVGACLLQRPDLFAVALPSCGVLDMLRYQEYTEGWRWRSEYGWSRCEEDFYNLLNYSPVHNVRTEVRYPATLVTTADHDDRVVPAHSYKFVAELQSKGEPSRPYLIRVETKGGHGLANLTKKINETVDEYTFFFLNIHHRLEKI